MIQHNESSGSFYYDFIRKGKRYTGVCTGCKSRRDAEFFEKRMKEHLLHRGLRQAYATAR